ncbi:hypothetical protein H632_c4889p0 [Helicosporidium sp. ATCC 50920]|nr:hypothetical protein H632_c4889p0 [Helicosporidium sp. ATCC 50920]|eukprot:KDD71508.1 hypothetical protein H632_c4889p0 [Helicosporidium sp. ATCC 50920]
MVAKAFARAGDVEGVERVLAAMERAGCSAPARQFAYSILISALARTRRAHAAENVLAHMRGQGVGVTAAHLAPLLSAYQRVGRPLEELLQLERRERAAVRGSQAFYATLVQACARHGECRVFKRRNACLRA